ncbi:unnamed protein product [Brachionus calyciflorus]|uniref:Glycosyltransferase 61 catalytic domain-containing protein n=1 Tax=Brachionus calyciflorus TaxID=104777 RepID=A0A814GL75_9BILA|nr:unnamed protein product [Brachionus calyciflorus]
MLQISRKSFLFLFLFFIVSTLIYLTISTNYIYEIKQPFQSLDLPNISHATSNTIETKIIECREFADLTSYCLYENVCFKDNDFIFLTTNKTLENVNFEFNGQLSQWDHYYVQDTNGKIMRKNPNNPLPFRSFISGKYSNPLIWKESKIHHEGCHSFLAFDFHGHNIFHWSIKVSPLFLFKHYNKNNVCLTFKSIRLISRSPNDLNDWQRNFLEISSDLKIDETNYEFTNKANSNRYKLQCYKHVLVPGTSIYLFTGPKEAIDFREKVSRRYGIVYERRKVIIIKRKNRLIVNQNEFEEFIREKFGNESVECIFLEELNFQQQVEKISKAKLLIGVHGAGLTNGIFVPTLGTIIEITAPHFHYPLYERIAVQSGHIFFRFVTQYDPKIHADTYAKINSIDCLSQANCMLYWKNAALKVDISNFSVILDQALEVL